MTPSLEVPGTYTSIAYFGFVSVSPGYFLPGETDHCGPNLLELYSWTV